MSEVSEKWRALFSEKAWTLCDIINVLQLGVVVILVIEIDMVTEFIDRQVRIHITKPIYVDFLLIPFKVQSAILTHWAPNIFMGAVAASVYSIFLAELQM